MKKIIYVSLISALLLSACSYQTGTSKGEVNETSTSTNSETSIPDLFGSYKEEDMDSSYDDSASIIELSESTTLSEGIDVDQQTITITEPGAYVLTGELTDGQVIIDIDNEEKVHLVLNGVTITNSQGPAILVEQAEKVITTLVADTTNTLTDGTDYQLDTDEDEPDATFYSEDELVINGEGELVVNGNYNNGIRSKDDLILISGTYTVNAKNNALKGKDSVQILDGNFTLTTEEGDGIQANNSKDESKGFIAIDGGNFTIYSGRDGIQAETAASIQEADITIQTKTDSVSDEESYKGIKVKTELLIQSGTYNINTIDDSLHSDGDIVIESGDLLLTTEDDGIHADDTLTINDGNITVADSYEGLEAGVITINDGDINVTASDDGLNASGDSGTTEGSETMGGDSFDRPGGVDQVDESKMIIINGGTLAVNAQGDGLDSNGNIQMSGGIVTVNGPTSNGDGALDYDGTFDLSGGILISAGGSGMAMNVSESSSQASFGIYFNETQEAGTVISLQDSNGNVIVTYQPSKSFQHLVVSSPELEVGETYTLIQGTEANNSEKNGYYEDGSIINGIELGDLVLSDTITNVTETGEEVTQRGMMGGPPGAMPNDGPMPDDEKMPNGSSEPDDRPIPNDGKMPNNGPALDDRPMPDDGIMPNDSSAPNDDSAD